MQFAMQCLLHAVCNPLRSPPSSELAVLYGLTAFVVLAHCHYGACVVHEMCGHFGIRPFHIR